MFCIHTVITRGGGILSGPGSFQSLYTNMALYSPFIQEHFCLLVSLILNPSLAFLPQTVLQGRSAVDNMQQLRGGVEWWGRLKI